MPTIMVLPPAMIRKILEYDNYKLRARLVANVDALLNEKELVGDVKEQGVEEGNKRHLAFRQTFNQFFRFKGISLLYDGIIDTWDNCWDKWIEQSKGGSFPKLEKEIKYEWTKYTSSQFMGLRDRGDEYYRQLANDMATVDKGVF